MRNKKRGPFEPLNFDNKGNLIPNIVFNNIPVEHDAKDTTTYRTTVEGDVVEIYQRCFNCEVVKPMSSFPKRSDARIRYLTFGITESWCRDCWNERKRMNPNPGSRTKRKKEIGATLDKLFG